jgi:hypothetical protein
MKVKNGDSEERDGRQSEYDVSQKVLLAKVSRNANFPIVLRESAPFGASDHGEDQSPKKDSGKSVKEVMNPT